MGRGSSLDWNPVGVNFSGSNQARAAGMEKISQVGTIFGQMRQQAIEQEQRDIDNAYRTKMLGLQESKFEESKRQFNVTDEFNRLRHMEEMKLKESQLEQDWSKALLQSETSIKVAGINNAASIGALRELQNERNIYSQVAQMAHEMDFENMDDRDAFIATQMGKAGFSRYNESMMAFRQNQEKQQLAALKASFEQNASLERQRREQAVAGRAALSETLSHLPDRWRLTGSNPSTAGHKFVDAMRNNYGLNDGDINNILVGMGVTDEKNVRGRLSFFFRDLVSDMDRFTNATTMEQRDATKVGRRAIALNMESLQHENILAINAGNRQRQNEIEAELRKLKRREEAAAAEQLRQERLQNQTTNSAAPGISQLTSAPSHQRNLTLGDIGQKIMDTQTPPGDSRINRLIGGNQAQAAHESPRTITPEQIKALEEHNKELQRVQNQVTTLNFQMQNRDITSEERQKLRQQRDAKQKELERLRQVKITQ